MDQDDMQWDEPDGKVFKSVVRSSYRDGWRQGHAVGVKLGQSTLSYSWFMVVIMIVAFAATGLGIIMANTIPRLTL